MRNKPKLPESLPKGIVAALVGLAIVTAFFVGRSVTEETPTLPVVTTSDPLDAMNAGAALDSYQAAAVPVPMTRPATDVGGSASKAVEAVTPLDAATPVPDIGPESAEPAPADPEEDADLVKIEPPPIVTDGEVEQGE
jgi:hypothetical protein